MKCPRCSGEARPVSVQSVTVDRCQTCGGTWYEASELRLLKDKAHNEDYRWIDFNLWRERERFRADEQEGLTCPKDASPLLTVRYGDSTIRVDTCGECQGIWLDKGEFARILEYLEEEVSSRSVGDYLEDVKAEFVEIFRGGQGPLAEIQDLAKVLYLLQLRFIVQHPRIAGLLRGAAKGTPGST